MNNRTEGEIIEAVIRRRKTEKVMCDVDAGIALSAEVEARNRAIVRRALETAGWAPFHYPRKVNAMAEPWRAHVLWREDAQAAAVHLRDQLNTTTKEPKLAAACSALVLVTWLPEIHDGESEPESSWSAPQQRSRDEEHLAAAAAMVQNLLLVLTAHGMGTYWSSGGKFRGSQMFTFLSIPESERLLAAVFIEYPEGFSDDRDRKPGALRDSRCADWIREVTLTTES